MIGVGTALAEIIVLRPPRLVQPDPFTLIVRNLER